MELLGFQSMCFLDEMKGLFSHFKCIIFLIGPLFYTIAIIEIGGVKLFTSIYPFVNVFIEDY